MMLVVFRVMHRVTSVGNCEVIGECVAVTWLAAGNQEYFG